MMSRVFSFELFLVNKRNLLSILLSLLLLLLLFLAFTLLLFLLFILSLEITYLSKDVLGLPDLPYIWPDIRHPVGIQYPVDLRSGSALLLGEKFGQ